MIKYIYANNYKSFVNFKIEFDQISLLIGRNGSGKSNIFALIASVRDLIQGRSNALSNGFSNTTLTRWMKSSIQTIELCVANKDHDFVYRVEIEHGFDVNSITIISESVFCKGNALYQMSGGQGVLFDDNHTGSKALVDPTISGMNYIFADGKHRLLQEFREEIDKIIICSPNPRVMTDMVINDVYGPMQDFSNIASAYAGIMQLAPDMYNDLLSTLKEIEPSLKRVRIAVESYVKVLSFEYKFKDVDCSFKLNELSDGERMLFALYLLLYGYITRGMTVLLDEPDNFISLREIQPWCTDIERITDTEGQTLMISHHPEIIDYMAETRGVWISRLESGESIVTNAPDMGDNKDLLTYSQMISRGILDEIK